MSDRIVLYKAAVAALLALVLGQALLLRAGEAPLLVTLARGGEKQVPPSTPVTLTLAQTVEGLTRLDSAPEILLDREQARRLVPVMPLVRDALNTAEPTTGAPTVEHFGAMLLAYLQRTLTPDQFAHVQALAARGELTSKPAEILDRLPALDKALRQRAGLSLTEGVAVRRSLEHLRVRDLLLGLLLLEEQPDVRLTKQQAELLLPMRGMIQESMNLQPGEIGKVTLPLLEAQVRAVLTDGQQRALVRLTDSKGIGSVEVNMDQLLEQFGTLLVARRTSGRFRFDLVSILERQPMDAPREGPAVIPQRADLELPVVVRGILLQLEKHPTLRLTDEQVDELALMAPRVQQCLTNLMNRVMDEGIPEVEGRVARLLTPEQLRYLREHQHDEVPMLAFTEGEEPVAKELGRFLEARSRGVAYEPRIDTRRAPSQPPATPAAPASVPPPPRTVASAQGGVVTPTPGSGPPSAFTPPAPGVRPSPVPKEQLESAATSGTRPSPEGPPLEAVVRGILFSLEKDRDLRLQASQVERLRSLSPSLRAQLDEIQAGKRSEAAKAVQRQLEAMLTKEQLAAVYEAADEPPLPLHASTGESPLSREVRRFVEARSANRDYTPLKNPEAP